MNSLEQEKNLIALIEAYRDRECKEQLDAADIKRQEMIQAAYADARVHLHQAVERERARAVSRIRSAEAELHTKRRAIEQHIARSFLKEGWQLLRNSLMQRWQDRQGRLNWIKRCASEALERLPLGRWTAHYPATCQPDEVSPFNDLIAQASKDTVIEMLADDKIKAGMIIVASDTYLDMSLEGLLRDEKSLEARMLALRNRGKVE
jgi:hypothetical protein